MQAIRIHQYGAPHVLQLERIAPPSCGPHEVLLRVIASGVNPIDWKIRSGRMAQAMPQTLPLTPGWECAGVVQAVGSAASGLRPGQAVFAMAGFHRGGSYAELLALDAAWVSPKPASLGFAQAASVPMTALAAWAALERAQLRPGQRLLVHGGAGGVGAYAIQLAKAAGLHVSTTTHPEDAARATALGADLVLPGTRPTFAEQLGDLDAVLDTVGGATQDASWATLRPGGILLSLVQPPAPGRAEAIGVRAEFVLTQPSGAVLREIARRIDAGRLQAAPCQVYPLADAPQVHALGEARRLRGRAVLRVAPD